MILSFYSITKIMMKKRHAEWCCRMIRVSLISAFVGEENIIPSKKSKWIKSMNNIANVIISRGHRKIYNDGLTAMLKRTATAIANMNAEVNNTMFAGPITCSMLDRYRKVFNFVWSIGIKYGLFLVNKTRTWLLQSNNGELAWRNVSSIQKDFGTAELAETNR